MKKLKTIFCSPRTYALATIAQGLALAFIVSIASVSAQQPPPQATKPVPLTAEEQQQWAQVLNVEKQRADAVTVAVNDLLNTQPGPDSVTVHARYQSAWLALRLTQSQRGEWLAKLQAAHDCPDCTISQDGKTLTKPKPQKE